MRERIISEIRRIAREAGQPPGVQSFEKLSGIRTREWRGKFWSRWSEALVEAGFEPNQLNEKIEPNSLLTALADVALAVGKLPTEDEYIMHARNKEALPSYSAIKSHFGKRESLIEAIRTWAIDPENDQHSTILEFLPEKIRTTKEPSIQQAMGHVYLLRSGEYYKIGQSSDLEKRVKSINVALPDKATLEHAISTDDPPGIEAYWHRRFADRRMNGEWFKLSKADILAFKKRKFQ